ncbi:alpha/beta fold hydrolase [Streptomyces sp. NBC_01515]|uniref:alpha/beta hydrolase family protein n=1 Tax=Streptomyces sp. NBC_01515 TaxID=2903890 RepID=UPI0038666EA8
MKFLFRDESFSFETLRTAGYGAYGGAELGEVIATTQGIRNKDEHSWLRAWKATAERVHALGEDALAAGHRVSAREALLRASNYYRTAEFFQREHPATDPEVALLSRLARETFASAAALLDTPVEELSIPYETTTLPGYLFLVDDSGRPRPTVVYNSGYDSTLEESYFAIAAAALRRGYNVLAFDGPGQGAALREQHLVFRPDWEAVVTPVIDYALTRKEIDADTITLFGYSLGGYLVARAAAFDHRVAALILDDGIYDFYAPFSNALPGFLERWIEQGRDDRVSPFVRLLTANDVGARWGLRNGAWAMGAESYPDLIRKTRAYTLEGIADRVQAPTLIMDAEDDHFLKGQPQAAQNALVNAATTLVTLTGAEGAGEHVHVGAMTRAHQVMFDWLDDTLAAA